MLYALAWYNSSEGFYYLINFLQVFFILTGLMVILAKNPIISVLYLIALFLLVASYLILLGVHFLGISYLLVYIGAVSILFLFILMLIDIRISELHLDSFNNTPLASVIGILFFSFLLFYNPMISTRETLTFYNSGFTLIPVNPVNYVFTNSWEGFLIEYLDISVIGNVLYTNYSIYLILALLILVLAMVGAIVINLDTKIRE